MSMEKVERVAILGPNGTFTEEAFLTQSDLSGAEVLLCPTIADVFVSVNEGTADLGFVALENSIEGGVNVTLDNLAFESELLIQREVVLPVRLNLWGLKEAELDAVKQVLSFPQAIAQCRKWLKANLPKAETHAADSTATAVRIVAEGGDVATAAIGTKRGGELHRLKLLAGDIADHPDNKTRFVAVGQGRVPLATGHDRTSVVIFQREDRPGTLLTILQEFAARSINLTRLESRPTKEALGDYCFLIDFWGHIQDDLIADCLANIRVKYADVKFLGSYPAAGDDAQPISQRKTADWQDTQKWLTDLRDKIR